MIYLYAITDRPDLPPPTEPGMEGTFVFSQSHQKIAAVVSCVTVADIQATEAGLWQHERIVETLMADRAVLPVRFGTVLRDESTVRASLVTHYARFVTQLDRVRGRVEVSLKILWKNDGEPERIPATGKPVQQRNADRQLGEGRAFMIGRLKEELRIQARRRQAEALAGKLHFPLSQLAEDSTRRILITPNLLLTAAYLLERDRVSDFQREITNLSESYPTLRFLCTGPWPAYTFVTATVPEISDDEREVHV